MDQPLILSLGIKVDLQQSTETSVKCFFFPACERFHSGLTGFGGPSMTIRVTHFLQNPPILGSSLLQSIMGNVSKLSGLLLVVLHIDLGFGVPRY